MKNLKWIVVGILALIIAVSAIFYWNFRHSPQYALKQIVSSIKNHDVATFEKYVVLDKVLNKLLSTNYEKDSYSDITFLIENFTMPILKERIINEIEKLPNSDSWSLPSVKNRLFDNFKDIKFVKKEGVLSIVGISFFDFVKKQDAVMELIMRKQDDHWQLIEIKNLYDIVSNIEVVTNNMLIEHNGKFRKNYNGYEIIVNQSQFDKRKNEIKKYLYPNLKIASLNDFILSKIKNKNIIKFFKTRDYNTEDYIAEYELFIDNNNPEDKIKNKSKVFFISIFNNDFARAYFYFRDIEKFSSQESIDRAYVHAYSLLIFILKHGFFNVYVNDVENIYFKNKNVEEKYVFVSTDEFMKILSEK